jgi:hypothetical protein
VFVLVTIAIVVVTAIVIILATMVVIAITLMIAIVLAIMVMPVAVVVVVVVTIVSVVIVLVFAMLVRSVPVRPIPRVVFRRSNEIHRSIARVVFVTVPAPVLRVVRRHMEVYRLDVYSRRRPIDVDGLRVHDGRRRPVGQVHPAVDSGGDLTGDRYANTQVTGSRQGSGRAEHSREQRYGTNHFGHHKLS